MKADIDNEFEVMAIKVKLGIAPIGWTNDDVPELGGQIPFEQCIDEMALAGYQGCEVGNKFPRDVDQLKKALELRKLKICNQWFSYTLTVNPLNQVRKEFEDHLDFLEAMGADIVGGGECGNSIHSQAITVLGKKVIFTEEEWKNVTRGLDELGKIAKDRGFKLAYHHHMGTGIQTITETDRLLDSTNSDYVFLNYDCGHFTFAGEDPAMALKRYINRVAHIHLKDVRQSVLATVKNEGLSFLDAVKAGVFTVPGDKEGSIDFPLIFGILERSNYEGWLVVEAEQDPANANPLEYATMAKNYITEQLSAQYVLD